MLSTDKNLYSLKRIWQETKNTSLALPLILLGILSVPFSSVLILPYYLGEITSSLLLGSSLASIVPLTSLTVIILMVGYCIELASNNLAAHINRKICFSLTARHFSGQIRCSLLEFLKFDKSDFEGTISDVLELLQTQQLYILQNTIRAALTTIGTLAILLHYNILLFLITFPFVIAICVLPIWLASRASPYIDREPQLFAKLGNFLGYIVKSRQLLHFYDADPVLKTTGNLTDELHHAQTGKWWTWNLSANVKLTQNFMLYALLLLGSGYLYFENHIELHSVVAAYVLVTMATPKFDSLYKLYNYAQSSSAAYRTLDRLLISPGAKPKAENTAIEPLKSISLEFQNFGHHGQDKLLFENIALELKIGEKCLISGESGSGKSTLLDLLLGLKQPSGVELRINGKPLSNEQKDAYWQQVAYIPNPDLMFQNLTMQQNIELYGTSGDETVSRSLELDILDDKTCRNLSGGELQRLSLIRALSRDKAVLIFDEPTSALDSKMQHTTFQLLGALEDKIIIVASHCQGIDPYFDRVFEIEKNTLRERA